MAKSRRKKAASAADSGRMSADQLVGPALSRLRRKKDKQTDAPPKQAE